MGHIKIILGLIIFKWGKASQPFCLFSFFSQDKYSTKLAKLVCLVLEPGAAGW